ncbi:MAG: hypothetical protein IAG10_33410, partial [Planctomycetaceae bacterium]|nr:hypothetical protein [Planctomycetaceae bacterium]
EFSANDLLERGETDLCVLIGAETVPYFSPLAQSHLRSIPTIVLDYPGSPPAFTPTIAFTTAVYGLHAVGTVYRMDNVPVQLRSSMTTELPTDADVLCRILAEHDSFKDQMITPLA